VSVGLAGEDGCSCGSSRGGGSVDAAAGGRGGGGGKWGLGQRDEAGAEVKHDAQRGAAGHRDGGGGRWVCETRRKAETKQECGDYEGFSTRERSKGNTSDAPEVTATTGK